MRLSEKYFPICTASLLVWVLAVCIIPNIWLSAVEPLTVVQAVTNVVLPLGLYTVLMTLSRHIGRSALWMIIAMVFAAFQLILLYMYGRSVIAVDMFLNVVTTNPGEVGELLGNLMPIMTVVIVFYLIPIVAAIVAVVKKWRLTLPQIRAGRRAGYILTIAGLLLLAVSFFQTRKYNPLTDLFPLNALYNVGIAVDRTVKTADYEKTSAGYSYMATDSRPDSIAEIYVAVIGETSRGDNWQLLGYGRPTNPLLSAKSGLLAFNKAISQSNTTHKSVPLLLSELDADSFGDSIYVTKGLLTAFKEAGFRTAFISNQARNHSFIDFFGEEADTTIFIRDYAPEGEMGKLDLNLIPYLDRELARGDRKHLIVLHTYGSHFNYRDRYPRSMARFTPDGPAEASAGNRAELINAYDNSILVADSLLAAVIDRLEARGGVSGLIYTSDHGEDIFDDYRRLFLHASPCPSYYQIHVPMLIWLSPGFIGSYPEMYTAAESNRNKFVASSQAYFHTLMEMAGIKSPRVKGSRSLVNSGYVPEAPRYLNDHNESVSWEDAGLLPVDFQKLDSLLRSVR